MVAGALASSHLLVTEQGPEVLSLFPFDDALQLHEA